MGYHPLQPLTLDHWVVGFNLLFNYYISKSNKKVLKNLYGFLIKAITISINSKVQWALSITNF